MNKAQQYQEVLERIKALTEGENNEISLMATINCELHHAFDDYHWTGFYRLVEKELLKVGPYQGGHGCLVIPFNRGVCGACATEEKTQLVPDVHALPYHIACSSTTLSEIVLPVFNQNKKLIAVFDVDSNKPAAFDEVDQKYLEEILRIFENRKLD